MSDAPAPGLPPDAERPAGIDGQPAPALGEAAQRIGDASLDAARSAWSVLTSLRSLIAADLSLSRSAFGLTLVYTGIAIALGASAWLLLMAVVVLGLQATGLSLLVSLLLPALLSATGAGICIYIGSKVFADTRLCGTRRQLARLGLAEDPEQVERNPEQVP